ncbi:hypothetical protein [Hymenobacter sp. APR13]|uniref:hypothetical protein n=1 Tax=Hymenobacter sp. APR13 TaxID=1356852 RepID=UPI0004E096D3|nr:hypothetical protein [Hymenobacter sp. APR13]AII54053.1 hypothetical protein N008_18965 [Hymenobacter sp. APR13]
MMSISASESFGYFVSTLKSSSGQVLRMEDQVVEYMIFEEFECNAITFLHENTLDILLTSKYIPKSIYWLAQRLRVKALDKFSRSDALLRTARVVRQDREWLDIMGLSDQILGQLIAHSGAEIRRQFQF